MSVQAILLAAGRGARMRPFHLARPKALLPILGRPLLEWTRDHLAEAGVSELFLVASPEFAPMLRGYAPPERVAADAGGLGTAASAWAGVERFAKDDAPILVLEGDVWIDPADLASMIRAYRGEDAVVLLDPLAGEPPQNWIVAECEESRVLRFLGHPREGGWRVSGAYLLSPRALRELAGARHFGVRVPVGGMPHREYDLAEALNDFLERGGEVAARRAEHPVWNLDKPWHLYQANLSIAQAWARKADSGLPAEARIDGSAQIEGSVQLGPGSYVGRGVIIRGAVRAGARTVIDSGAILQGTVWLGDDVRVDEYAKVSNSVIGNRCLVSHTAEMIGGVLMDGVALAHYCEVYGILGEAVDIGAGTVFGTLRFDDGRTAHRVRGRWETPAAGANASYVGDHARTGVNVTVLPGKTIGSYSAVGPGVVVDTDIDDFQLVTVKQTWETRKWGPERYDW